LRAALCAACIALSAGAEADDRSSANEADLRTVLFGSLDGERSSFATVGVKRTLQGTLDQSGAVGMASLGYGRTVERAWWHPDDLRVTRHAVHASALIGYQWIRDGLVVAALAGPEVEGERLSDHR
jgi:hypothetical protein